MKKQFTKALAVLLTLCMLAGMMILPTSATVAQQSNEALSPDTSWFKFNVAPQTYEITTAAELLGFMEIAQKYNFDGDTIQLMADIDLNPGWDATTTIADDGTVTLADAPANVWTAIPVFKGTLDGNGHTISGIYSESEFMVPSESFQRYVGGFINELVNGTVKNLIVKNSLATFSSPTGTYGTSRIRIGGLISRVVDSNVQTLYADVDTWVKFDYSYTLGGVLCSIETEADDNNYVGTIEEIVNAGCVGRIVDGKNNQQGEENGTDKIFLGDVIGYTADNSTKITIHNVSFIGWSNGYYCRENLQNTTYTKDIVYTGTNYPTKGFVIDGYSLFSSEEPNNYPGDGWENGFGSPYYDNPWKNPSNAKQTWGDKGFKLHTFTAGNGSEVTGVLPGTVVDMLNASNFETDFTTPNEAIEVNTDWFPLSLEPKTYYLYTPEQLLGFAKITQKYNFANDTVKLMADIDLNQGWDATTTIADDGTVTLADAPANVWTAIPVFKGTLDGNGHTISGIYSESEFMVPSESFQRYVGGFINELVNGTVKNLIVKNSLATFSSPTGTYGTSRIRIGGLISRVVDSNVQTLYADVDTWVKFDYSYTLGGVLCSIETEADDNNYVGTIEEIVNAGCVGRIVDGKNNQQGEENGTDKIFLGDVIGYTADNSTKITIHNVSFIGWSNGYYCRENLQNTTYTKDIVYTGTNYPTKGFVIDGYSLFSSEEPNNYPGDGWENGFGSPYYDNPWKNPSNAKQTWGDKGFKLHTFTAGNGSEVTGVLPGTVVDMLTKNTSNLYLQKSADGSKVRFVGVVNISEEEFENFSALGFDISMTYKGKKYTNTYTTTTVYESLTVNGTPVSATEYGGKYFYAVEITGLNAATEGDVVFTVDGITIHAGEVVTNVFGSGEYTYSAN